MNYYGPRQRQDTGLWHYTCRNDGRIWPVAGCSVWETCPDCKGRSFGTVGDCALCESKGVVKKAEPCPGHATAEEARLHAATHVIQSTDLERVFEMDWTGCQAEGCDAPTKRGIAVAHPDGRRLSLCSRHLNRTIVAAIVGDQLGDIYSSS